VTASDYELWRVVESPSHSRFEWMISHIDEMDAHGFEDEDEARAELAALQLAAKLLLPLHPPQKDAA
jgi:hypothetical protein